MAQEKVRIFALARELHLESKDLISLCQQHGIEIKNQLSTIDGDLRDQIVQLVRNKGSAQPAATATATRAPVARGSLDNRVQVLDTRRAPTVAPPAARQERGPRTEPDTRPPAPPTQAPLPPEAPAVVHEAPPASRHEKPAEPTPPTSVPPVAPPHPAASKPPEAPPAVRPKEGAAPETPIVKTPTPPAPAARQEPPTPRVPETPAVKPPETPPAPPVRPAATQAPTPTPPRPGSVPPVRTGPPPSITGDRVPDLNRGGGDARRPRERPTPRMGTYGIASRAAVPKPPPQLKQPPKPGEEKKPPPKPAGPRKIAEIPKEMQNQGGQVNIREIMNRTAAAARGGAPAPEVGEVPEIADDAEGDDGKGKKPRLGTGVIGRDARHKGRAERQAARKKTDAPVLKTVRGLGGIAVVEQEERHRGRRHDKLKKLQKGRTQPRKGKVPIAMPITVRSLSEAMGVRANDLIGKLMAQNLMVTINSTLDPELAETVALENGCELDVKRQLDAEDKVLAEAQKPDEPEDLVPRAPVVTIMGHVDHGKTSLLDQIRKTNVVDTEAGGITQVIRAWRVKHGDNWITFLDTPGHEAFTKMRARGANVTDIAVIVVAADDGVMPQTEEAISHAKAAGVKIVVAINKVDLPNANLKKTEQQLYSLDLLPDNMGGDIPFVLTSAATGRGIDDLLEAITIVAELEELKGNPNKPGSGVCLEAHLSEEEGVLATLLVQEGTLRQGDVIVCGASYGRVRAMYNDLGKPLDEAGPSVPVRVAGLDEVPNADDPFQVVPELAMAREIGDKRKARSRGTSLVERKPVSLESLTELKIDELKVILKAEARGSIEAIRKELEKLHHAEVRVRILHAAIGGITESDVQLALTSPQDTLILGFNVVPDDRAHALAEERGIQIRQYNIIYQLTDDVRAALEGKLKPREEVVHLGRAVVRETFKISRVGTIAGCYVTQGTIERSAKVRVIRSGVVVYPPADRTVALESLKRFKEDVREVREGFECGLKIAGYDDIKVDDVIEAYRVDKVQRTLTSDK